MAHSSNVSSLVLGKSSSRLLATGGEDCRVNIWAVNKPNCIMVVDPGGGRGLCLLRIFKEESSLSLLFIMRLRVLSPVQSLTGHTSAVECVQFSSSEEQVVAGSQSGSLRVWDLEAAKSEFRVSYVC